MAKKKDGFIPTIEFANRLGVTRQNVCAAIARGRLTQYEKRTTGFFIHWEKGSREWEETINKVNRKKVQARKAKTKKGLPDSSTASKKKIVTRASKNKKGFEDNPDGPRTYKGMTTADAERQEKFYKAEIAKLKFEEQAGLLMDTEKVKKAAFEVGRTIRDNMMSIAAKHSHELAAETDPHALEVLLTEKINQALGETIAVDFKKLKRG